MPPTPDVPTTARCTHSLAKSYGRAVARRRFDPGGVRCVLSASSHGSSPPFVWRAAEKPRSARAQDGASPPPHGNRVAIMHRSLCVPRGVYRGSLSSATTSLLPSDRAQSRAVSPRLFRSVGSAPPSRRRLAIARWPWAAAICNAVQSRICWGEVQWITTMQLVHGTCAWGRARSRLTCVASTLALDSRRIRTHPSLSLAAASLKAVQPWFC